MNSISSLKQTFRRPRDPDQIMVAHDVTTKFEVVDQNGDAIYYLVQADSCCSRWVLIVITTLFKRIWSVLKSQGFTKRNKYLIKNVLLFE